MCRRYLLTGIALLCGTTVEAIAQAPVETLSREVLQPPKLPEKKDDKKKDPPPVTLPATTAPAPNVPLTTAESSVQVTSLPPVYGDMLFGSTFSPYLIATLPNGQTQSVRPGVVANFPIGTTFNQAVQSQIVTIQTGTTTIRNPTGQGPPIVVPVFSQVLQVTGTPAVAHSGGLPVNVARGAFKIAENESPRPMDRIYATFHYFSDVNPTLSVPELPVTNVFRETLGFEKTFLSGDASIGLRVPLIQINGPFNLEAQSMGDLSVILKYAWINEYAREDNGPLRGGNVLSGGLVVTAPTGNTGAYSSQCPIIHSTLLQPWLGGIYVRGNVYVQGFSSVVIPTDSRDTSYFFNSFQLGWLAWSAPAGSRFLTSITPAIETHISTPLDNRGLTRLPIGATDIVSFTGGATFGLGSRSYLNIGANSPITGPRPYEFEAIAQLNFFY